jgi:hypothetical protein
MVGLRPGSTEESAHNRREQKTHGSSRSFRRRASQGLIPRPGR